MRISDWSSVVCSSDLRDLVEIDVVDLPLGIGARPPPLHPPELERARRRGRAVISGEVGDDLIGLAMAQRPHHPAGGLEGEAVAHRAVAFHLDGLDAHPVGLDAVAIRAFELLAEIITAAETRRHARPADGRPPTERKSVL